MIGLLTQRVPISAVRKRDGSLSEFKVSKIKTAMGKAAKDFPDDVLERLANEVPQQLEGPVVHVEKVQDTIESTLRAYRTDQFTNAVVGQLGEVPGTTRERLYSSIDAAFQQGLDKTPADAYDAYRRKRTFVRTLSRTKTAEVDTTDMSMVVEGDKHKIAFTRDGLMEMIFQRAPTVDGTPIPFKTAEEVAKRVEFGVYDAYQGVAEQGGVGEKDRFTISDVLLTELINLELHRKGLGRYMIQDDFIGLKTSDLVRLITERSKENSNLKANSSEAISFLLAENIRKKFALKTIFGERVAQAHKDGRVHVHDLGMPDRVYCSGHSIEYLKKWGLDLDNLDTSSAPANQARTLTGHINTFLASMQAYYAGALGLGFVNIMYAPYLEGLTTDEMMQEAQHLIFTGSQSAFSRGGQTLFLDFNVHTGIPGFLKNVPAIGPGGKYEKKTRKTLEEEVATGFNVVGERRARISESYFVDENGHKKYAGYHLTSEDGDQVALKNAPLNKRGKIIQPLGVKRKGDKIEIIYEETELVDEVPRYDNPKDPHDPKNGDALQPEGTNVRYAVYGDYKRTAQLFAKAMLEVWHKGDNRGSRFAFPKCDLHVNAESFSDPSQLEILTQACQIAGDTGDPYFVFDRSAVTLAACCRLRTAVNDNYVIKHPESMRFCGFQNITLNLPQAAYRTQGASLDEKTQSLFKELDDLVEIAVEAHQEKKRFSQSLMQPGLPLWQIGKPARDGKPYVDLNDTSDLVGYVGLNEAVQFLSGQQLHESDQAQELGLKIMSHIYQKALERSAESERQHKENPDQYFRLNLKLEESPAESATRRLIAIDRRKFPEQTRKVMKGSLEEDTNYYNNSSHLAADAPVDLTTRIQMQAMYNELAQAGAIIHAHVGEERIPAESVLGLVRKTLEKTNTAQLTISPTFTQCKPCGKITNGYHEDCSCGSKEVYQVARIVGYFSKIPDWNKSKKGELQDRQKGQGSFSVTRTTPEGHPYQAQYPDELVVHRHGKQGCGLCSIAGDKIEKVLRKYGDHSRTVFYDLNDETQRLESLKQAVSLTSYPTVVASYQGRELGRWVGTDFTKMRDNDFLAYLQQRTQAPAPIAGTNQTAVVRS